MRGRDRRQWIHWIAPGTYTRSPGLRRRSARARDTPALRDRRVVDAAREPVARTDRHSVRTPGLLSVGYARPLAGAFPGASSRFEARLHLLQASSRSAIRESWPRLRAPARRGEPTRFAI